MALNNSDHPYLQSREIAEKTNLVSLVRKTPLLLYGIFTELLQTYYVDDDNLPMGLKYVWIPDNEVPHSKKENILVIKSDFDTEENTIEGRPSIIVKVGDIQYSNIDDSKGSSTVSMDLENGTYSHSRKGVTTIQFIHIGRTKGEALLLAGATHDFLDAFSSIIRKDFCFVDFSTSSISTLHKDKEWSNRFICNVTANLIFEDSWEIKLETPKIKRINMVINNAADSTEDEIVTSAFNCCNNYGA